MHWSTAQKRARCAHTRLLKRVSFGYFPSLRTESNTPKPCGKADFWFIAFCLRLFGTLSQALLAAPRQTRPRFHLGSKDAFRRERSLRLRFFCPTRAAAPKPARAMQYFRDTSAGHSARNEWGLAIFHCENCRVMFEFRASVLRGREASAKSALRSTTRLSAELPT